MAKGNGHSRREQEALASVGQHAFVHEVGLDENGHGAVCTTILGFPHGTIINVLQGMAEPEQRVPEGVDLLRYLEP